MISRSIPRVLIVILILFQVNNTILAQQKSRIGLNITSNLSFRSEEFMPEIGLVFERRITAHSGIEANLNFRTYQNEVFIQYGANQSMYSLFNEKYITVPVLYKFYSKIVNIGVGVSYDYYMGWKQLTGSQEITSYWPGADYFIGLISKISKQATLSDKLILEPEIKFNILVLPSEKLYIGFGLVAKFDL